MQGQCPAHDTPWKIRLTVTECFDVTYMNWASLCGSAGKESTCKVGNQDSIPGLGRSPGEGKGCPLQYSGLENSMDCIVNGVAKSRTQLSDFHFAWTGCFLKKFIFNWRKITIQFSDGFCHTSAWINHRHIHVPSFLNLPPYPMTPGCQGTPALGSLHHTANFHRLSISPLVIYMFQYHSQVFPSSPSPTGTKSLSFGLKEKDIHSSPLSYFHKVYLQLKDSQKICS